MEEERKEGNKKRAEIRALKSFRDRSVDEMEDITFSWFMCIIINELTKAVMGYFHITEA